MSERVGPVGGEIVERPHETAKWGYMGEWVELDINPYQRVRVRLARADDWSWQAVSVHHRTRNGWASVGKKVAEGIAIGRAIERAGFPEDRYAWQAGGPTTPPDSALPAGPREETTT